MERIYIKGFVDIKGGDVYHLTFNWNIGGDELIGLIKLKWDVQSKKEVNWGSNDPPPSPSK